MKVVIYVEGTSDKAAMEGLLESLISVKQEEGILIQFIAVKGNQNDRGGDAKKELIINIPKKAVNIIVNNQDTIVVAMPDLYPKNKGFQHETVNELVSGIMKNFDVELINKGITDERLKDRFKVFCFKHDLEALTLAAESQLRDRLGINSLTINWRIPVEDQNHDLPPSKVLEKIFSSHGKKYKKTLDTPLILSKANYLDIAERCTQCFQPFIQFLESL